MNSSEMPTGHGVSEIGSGQSENGEGAVDTQFAPPVIEVSHVSKWHGDVVAVSDVSIWIDPGVTALLGPNGAGKTTLLNMLVGLTKPSTGYVRVLGQPIRGDVTIFKRIGLVPEQETVYPFLTGREFVRMNAVLQRLPEPDAATERALTTVELLGDADRPVRGYSKGMRQRVKIAAALVHEPDVLLLDEPLNGTDPIQRVQLIALMRALGDAGKTIVISSHVLHEVERFADRIIVIVNGKLAAAGDFHTIREKLDEHAHMVRVRSSNPRGLASALVQLPAVRAVHVDGDSGGLVVEADDVRALYRSLPMVARSEGVRLFEITALDDSLASVVAYVTER
jgi:ABC-2 type transport system ATP-binding protein